MNEFRAKLGYIQLDKMDIKNKQKINQSVISFEYNGEKYYFRTVKSVHDIYNELIAYEIGKKLGLNVVPSDIASIDERLGYISKDYMKDGYIFLEDLLNKTYETSEGRCNIDDTVFAFMTVYNEEVAVGVTNQLFDLFEYDVIIANPDRHDRNILIDTKNMCLGPIIDNELMLGDLALYNHYYSLGLNKKDDDQLTAFINILNDSQFEEFKSRIEVINADSILKIINDIETRLGFEMVDKIKEDIIKKFAFNYNYLSRLLTESKKKGRQIVLK